MSHARPPFRHLTRAESQWFHDKATTTTIKAAVASSPDLTVTPLIEELIHTCTLADLPVPFEAYFVECLEFISNLPAPSRLRARRQLNEISPTIAFFVDLTLDASTCSDLEANRSLRDWMDGCDQGALIERAVDVWRSAGRDVVDLLLPQKTALAEYRSAGWIFGSFAIDLFSLRPNELDRLKSRILSFSVSSQDLKWDTSDTHRLGYRADHIEFLLKKDPAWAQAFLRPQILRALNTGFNPDSYYMSDMLAELVLEYDISLSDNILQRLMELWLYEADGYDGDPGHKKYMLALLKKSKNPAHLADVVFNAHPDLYFFIPYLSAERIEEELESTWDPKILTALASTPIVASNLTLARRLVERYPQAASTLLRHGSAEVQQELINTGNYHAPLVSLLKSHPRSVKPGVEIPSTALAKALSSASKKKRPELFPLIKQARSQNPSPDPKR